MVSNGELWSAGNAADADIEVMIEATIVVPK